MIEDLDPVHIESKRLYESGKYKETVNYCDCVLAQDRNSQNAWMFRGAANRDLQNYQGAIDDFTALLKFKPHQAATLFALETRGIVYRRMGCLTEAMADANAALAIDANRYLALLLRGTIWHQWGQLKKAERDLEDSLALNASDSIGRTQATELLAEVRRCLEAEWVKTYKPVKEFYVPPPRYQFLSGSAPLAPQSATIEPASDSQLYDFIVLPGMR